MHFFYTTMKCCKTKANNSIKRIFRDTLNSICKHISKRLFETREIAKDLNNENTSHFPRVNFVL